jgi:hypothetical protein
LRQNPDEWPVCCLVFTEETPAYAALVAKPARRLRLEKSV